MNLSNRIRSNDSTLQELIIHESNELYCCPNFTTLCSSLQNGTNTMIHTLIVSGRVIELMTTNNNTTTTATGSTTTGGSTIPKNEITYFVECCSGLQNLQNLRLTISSDIVLTQRSKHIMALSISYLVQQRQSTLQSICIVPIITFYNTDIENVVSAFTNHPTLQKIYFMNLILNSVLSTTSNNNNIPIEGDDNNNNNNNDNSNNDTSTRPTVPTNNVSSSSFWFDPILLAFATIPNLSYLHIMFGSNNNNNNTNNNNNNNNNNNTNNSDSILPTSQSSQTTKNNVICTILQQRYNTLECLYISNYPFTNYDYEIIGETIQQLNIQYDPNKNHTKFYCTPPSTGSSVKDIIGDNNNNNNTVNNNTNNNGCRFQYITLQSSVTKQPKLRTYQMYYKMLQTNYTIEWLELMDGQNNNDCNTSTGSSSSNNNTKSTSQQKLQKLFDDIQFLLLLNRYNRKVLVSYTSTPQTCWDTICNVVESCNTRTIFQYNEGTPYSELDIIYEFVRCNPSSWIIPSK